MWKVLQIVLEVVGLVGPLPEHLNEVTVATATTKETKREQKEKKLVMTSQFDLFLFI